MALDSRLSLQIRSTFGRRHHVLCGRGTTALWLALRAIRRRSGPGDVIVPDILCATVLDGILLAGFRPIFAGVTADRFTLAPDEVARLATPDTRAIIAAHVFGHIADIDAIRRAAPGIPLIEDAVQGFGGHLGSRPAGALGDLSFVSFDEAKMVGGRGGVLLFDDFLDAPLRESLLADLHNLPYIADLNLDFLQVLLPPAAARAYAAQLSVTAPALLCRMNDATSNVERILEGWRTLPARVTSRNQKAGWLYEHLLGLPLTLPRIGDGDAIWRYSFAAPTLAGAYRVRRRLQLAGLNGSGLYYPLSRFFGASGAGALENRLVNLWVDESTRETELARAVRILQGIPWDRLPG